MVGWLIYSIGLWSILRSKEFLKLLLSIEILFIGLNILIIDNSLVIDDLLGQWLVILIISVVVSETALALGLVYVNYRLLYSGLFTSLNSLKG